MPKSATWTTLPDFEGHEINEYGEIRNKSNKQIMKTSVNQSGVRYATLRNTTEGRYQNRSLAKLVAKTFCEGETTIDDTVMHLDGNRENTHASNLMWAPHHHVIAFHEQVLNPHWQAKKRVVEQGGRIYRSYADAATATGSLPSEIRYSVQYNDGLAGDTHVNLVHRTSTGHIFRSV